jgi:hypothetical protein
MYFQAVRDQVQFWHRRAPMAADLVVPAGPGPYPAVAVVGACSGPRDRTPWIGELAHGGLMALSWDSPGWGESPGHPAWQAPDQRAPEVLAAVDYLARDPGVPAGGVGVVAAELGAWAGIMAASLSRRIEALVLVSPPMGPLSGHEVERVGRTLRAGGFITAEVELAQAVLRSRLRQVRSGVPSHVVLSGEAACRTAPWYPWLPASTPQELDAFAGLDAYDARTLLGTLSCPVLVVHVDRGTPAVWRDAQIAHRYLQARAVRDHRIVVVPDASSYPSMIWEVDGDGPRMRPGSPTNPVGVIGEWLAQRISRRPLAQAM